jgi:hypothetical protein
VRWEIERSGSSEFFAGRIVLRASVKLPLKLGLKVVGIRYYYRPDAEFFLMLAKLSLVEACSLFGIASFEAKPVL